MTPDTAAQSPQRTHLLDALIDSKGLTFSDCVAAFSERQKVQPLDGEPLEYDYVALAQEQWSREGEIEVDDTAIVSKGADRGAYVMAWVWVYDPEGNEEDDDG